MRRLALACACLALPAMAAAGCRVGGVEWIVGGPAASPCPAADAPRERATGATGASPASGASGAEWRVASATQRERDGERRRILSTELDQEQARQAQLRARPADADALRRSEENLRALRAELARLPPAGER